MSLKLQLFGPFRAFLDGHDLDLRSRRSQAILAMLALAPTAAVARDRLAATLWPDRADEQARASLRQELSSLRATLGKESRLVAADSDAVRIAADRVDPDFGQAEDGEFLEGLDLRSEPFDDWRREAVARIEGRAVSDVPARGVMDTGHDIFQNPSVLVMGFVPASRPKRTWPSPLVW